MPKMVPIFLLMLAMLFGILLLVFVIVNEMQEAKLSRRFDAYSLHTSEEQVQSIFDQFFACINSFLKRWGRVLKKSRLLSRYALKYEKYSVYENQEEREPIYYVALKFFLGFLAMFLSVIASFLRTKHVLLLSSVLAFLLFFFLPDILFFLEFQKKKKQIEQDLMKAVMILNNSFKSGKNIMQAIVTVKNELDGPISDEFKKIYLDMTYGLSLEVVFQRFYERVKLEDAKYIASSLTLLNKTGGNITNVFSSIEKSFYNKKKMRDELKSITASSLFVFRLLVVLPLVFTGFILLLNPTYFNPLFSSFAGWCLFGILLLFYFAYIWIIKKVLEVKM